jgi:hypothetical protein
MARGGKKSSGLDLAEVLIRAGCPRVSVLHGGFRSVVKCVQRHKRFRKLLGKGYRVKSDSSLPGPKMAASSNDIETASRKEADKLKAKMEDIKDKVEEEAKKIWQKDEYLGW